MYIEVIYAFLEICRHCARCMYMFGNFVSVEKRYLYMDIF